MIEEKVLIKSEQYNIKKISLRILIVGILVGLMFLPMAFSAFPDKDMGYMLTSAIPFYCGLPFLPIAIIAGVFYWYASKISLTVSNKRVYGTAVFGRRIDLPIDMISAVGTVGWLKGISVSTTSGYIKFVMIKNVDEIHDTISKLLMDRQENKSANTAHTTIREEISQSNADELKKYKDLLDSGVITQEEFDKKKKQLLGL